MRKGDDLADIGSLLQDRAIEGRHDAGVSTATSVALTANLAASMDARTRL
jgi:hypothetical protein